MSSTFSALTLVLITFLLDVGGVLDFHVAVWIVLGLAVLSGVAVDVARATTVVA